MCSKEVLNKITEKICIASKEVLGEKLEKVILFGSYARGDYDEESDIDIMVLADIEREEANAVRRKIRDQMGYLSLEYDVVVSLHMACSVIFHRFVGVMPYYKNVVKDGIELYA